MNRILQIISAIPRKKPKSKPMSKPVSKPVLKPILKPEPIPEPGFSLEPLPITETPMAHLGPYDSPRISIVIPAWNSEAKVLERMLYTLANQSRLPFEIVVVDGAPGYLCALCSDYPLLRIIEAPVEEFSLSKLFNYGIKRVHEDVEYVMTTGVDRLFSQSYLEEATKYITPRSMLWNACGFLKGPVNLSGDIFARWDAICDHIIPGSQGKISPGTLLIVHRDWWFRVRGYDEDFAFAFLDSDITARGRMSGLGRPGVPWRKAQVLHQWHPPSPLVARLGGTLAEIRKKTSVVRNLDGWGEL